MDILQRRGESWTDVPISILKREIGRRAAEGERPACGSEANDGSYNTSLHVWALILILALSSLSCVFPILVRRFPRLPVPHEFLFLSRHFGTGVLIATAFVHLLPTAFSSLTDPCLPPFWNKGYPAMAGLVAMIAVFIAVGVEMFFATRGAGHHHHHHQPLHGPDHAPAHGGDHVDGDWAGVGNDHDSDSLPMRKPDSRYGHDDSFKRSSRQPHQSLDDDGTDITLSPKSPASPTHIPPGREERQSLVESVSPRNKRHRRHLRSDLKDSHTVDDDDDDDNDDADNDNDNDNDDNDDILDLDPITASIDAPPLPKKSGSVSKPFRHGPDGPGRARASISSLPSAAERDQKQLMQVVLLEAGILFHSIFIGLALSVTTGPSFVVLLVAIGFHQTFEGLALGARIAALRFRRASLRPWLMAAAFGTTTPAGQALGLAMRNAYDPASAPGLLLVGLANAASAGLLLFAGLVGLLAQDFLSDASYAQLTGRSRRNASLSVLAGAFLMATVGAFA